MMLYDELKDKVKTLKPLVKYGVIDPRWLRNIEIYKRYLYMRDVGVYNKYELLAEEFNLSSETIRKIVFKMKN